MVAVCVIQGASRGIGLQFCKNLLIRNNTVVVATCRNPAQASELQMLKGEFSNKLSVLPLDVTNEEHIANAAEEVSKKFSKVDLLINSAGILHPSGRGETSLKITSAESLQTTFLTNTIGPLMMAKHFAPLLAKGESIIGKSTGDKQTSHVSVLVNMSAKVGSITENGLGGWYSYRMSKAALNMATKNLSIELGRGQRKVVCVSMHPGTVDTSLSRPYHKNVKTLFSTEQSVEYMMNVIDSLSYHDSGKFLLYDRKDMPF